MRLKTLFASVLASVLACAALANPPTTSPEQGMFIAEELAVPNLANMATKEATAPAPVAAQGDQCMSYIAHQKMDGSTTNVTHDDGDTARLEVTASATTSAQGGHFLNSYTDDRTKSSDGHFVS